MWEKWGVLSSYFVPAASFVWKNAFFLTISHYVVSFFHSHTMSSESPPILPTAAHFAAVSGILPEASDENDPWRISDRNRVGEWGMSPPPPSDFTLFSSGSSDAIISPPWLGCSSLELWKSRIGFTVQQIALVGLICEEGGWWRRQGHSQGGDY